MSPTSEPSTAGGPRACSIADALGVVGDRWALLVLREINLGVRRFNEIRSNTGAPRDTLTKRIGELEQHGLIERRRYNERPPRDEYFFTELGAAIRPVLRELRKWGEGYAAACNEPGGSGGPTELTPAITRAWGQD